MVDVVRDGDGWHFVVGGGVVTQIRVDYQFSLLLEDGVIISIDEPFTLVTRDGAQLVPPGAKVYEVGAALPLFGQTIDRLTADPAGRLSVEFTSGTTVEVGINPAYENWQISHPDGRQWIGLPGGGVAEFPASV